MSREFIRFLLAGGLNTAVTYGIYLALLLVLPYPLAYTASYVSGIFLSYYLNARFVFKESLSWGKAVQYPVVYVVQYLLGLLLLYLLVDIAKLDKAVAPIAIVLVSVPVTFVLSRYVIRGRSHSNPRR